MLFLSPGIVYRLKTLLHWFDNNTVLTVDVLRVYSNSLPQKTGRKQNQSVNTQCISEMRNHTLLNPFSQDVVLVPN